MEGLKLWIRSYSPAVYNRLACITALQYSASRTWHLGN